jgi:hypothetical protein
MGCSIRRALVLSLLVLAPALVAQPAPRRPRGIYALVNITEQTNIQTQANPCIRRGVWKPISSVCTKIC